MVIETEEGITVYPARWAGDRWRAVWYEDGERRQCQGISEEKLAVKLVSVAERLTADAPNMLRHGEELIAFYLSPDRRPAGRQWSRKHADAQQRLCARYLAPVIGQLTCQDIKIAHLQAAVNAAPTAGVVGVGDQEDSGHESDLSGVSGTPTFFGNGRRHYGSYDITALTAAVLAARPPALPHSVNPDDAARSAAAAPADDRWGRMPWPRVQGEPRARCVPSSVLLAILVQPKACRSKAALSREVAPGAFLPALPESVVAGRMCWCGGPALATLRRPVGGFSSRPVISGQS